MKRVPNFPENFKDKEDIRETWIQYPVYLEITWHFQT
jgi:hypothetical protein